MDTTEHNGLSQTSEMTGDSGDSGKVQVQSVAEQGERKVVNIVDNARDQIKSQLANQKDQASTKLEHVADSLKQTSSDLKQHGQAVVGDYANAIAGEIEHVSAYLHDHDLNQIARDTENFGRQRPAMMLSAAFLLGVIAARFIKSSQRYG